MDSKILVEEDINSGKKIIQYLDGKGLVIRVALWLYNSDSNRWHLVISIPEMEDIGSTELYLKIINYLKEMNEDDELDVNINDIKLIPYTSNLVTILKMGIGTDDGISSIRFQNNMINGHLIEDAFIYRVT